MNCGIHQAIEVARFLWPKFEIRRGAVLAVDFVGYGSTDVSSRTTLTEAEIFLNHVHVLDLFENAAKLETEPFYDPGNPDFKAACTLGMLAAECWAAKLHAEFPDRTFRVFYTQDDNPIVRFHQVRDGEPPFLDESDWAEAIEQGRIAVHHVVATG